MKKLLFLVAFATAYICIPAPLYGAFAWEDPYWAKQKELEDALAVKKELEDALAVAMSQDNVAQVETLLCEWAWYHRIRGWTLHIAVLMEYEKVVELLLQKTTHINMRNADGMTPLCIAASSSNIKIMALLLAAGADPNMCAQDGRSPLYLATYRGRLDIVTALLRAGADVHVLYKKNESLLHAVVNGCTFYLKDRVLTAQLLLDAGLDIDRQDSLGFTALALASRKKMYHLVELLLKSGANKEIPNFGGYTPLTLASIGGYSTIVELLLRY